MKKINGKDLYVSIGYVSPDKLTKKGPNIKDINSIYVKTKSKKSTVYVDDSDKDNVIVLPLIPVNDIQKSGIIFKITALLNPKKVEFGENELSKKINVFGLFCIDKKGKVETVKHIQFYYSDEMIFTKNGSTINISIAANVNKLLEATKNE